MTVVSFEKVQSVPKKVRIVPDGLLSFADMIYFRKSDMQIHAKEERRRKFIKFSAI